MIIDSPQSPVKGQFVPILELMPNFGFLNAAGMTGVHQNTRKAGSCPSRIWPPSAIVVWRTKAWAATAWASRK